MPNWMKRILRRKYDLGFDDGYSHGWQDGYAIGMRHGSVNGASLREIEILSILREWTPVESEYEKLELAIRAASKGRR